MYDYIVIRPRKPRRKLLTADEIHELYHPNYEGVGFTVKSVSHRLRRLEQTNRIPYRDVLLLIEKHRYYDTLTDAERERYCAYAGESRAEVEAEAYELLNDLHFMLMKITKA